MENQSTENQSRMSFLQIMHNRSLQAAHNAILSTGSECENIKKHKPFMNAMAAKTEYLNKMEKLKSVV